MIPSDKGVFQMKKCVFPIILALFLLCFSGCGGKTAPVDAAVPSPTVTPTPTPTPSPTPTPPPEPTVATLAVCGDVMSHSWQVDYAYDPDTSTYDYRPMMAGAKAYVEEADLAVANLETTLAGGPEYTGYPRFHSPDALAYNLKDMGFDLLLTANNHCMDTRVAGLRRTLDVLDEAGLSHVGTSRTQEEADDNIVVADVGGISVAFLGYTYGTNGLPIPDEDFYAVNLFNSDYLTSISTPDVDRLTADLAKARAKNADLICVMIHWGLEYHTTENWYQHDIADLLIQNGADIILGGHSHVPQPIELRTVTLDDGTERTAFVSYSLGNFISAQVDPLTDTTAVLQLQLTRDNVTGETAVTGWDYQPMFMLRRDGGHSFLLLDSRDALENFDLTDAERKKVESSVKNLEEILGPAPGLDGSATPEA